jgi:MinD-like ATPase involved in chromosome partitioning or flagellar assembly
MTEPEVALAFTPDPWVEALHRYLTDHGGARVRCLIVEPGVAVEESYDVLVAGHRWPPLTVALVADVHERGRLVLGVFDREEPVSREHLRSVGVDELIESDASLDAMVRAIAVTARRRGAPAPAVAEPAVAARSGRLVAVGGAPGSGRTEVAIHLASAFTRTSTVALIDADDVAPAIAQRLHLAIEPNLCVAVDAVEHGRGELDACVQNCAAIAVLAGMPNARAWTQVRPGEVVRVIDHLGAGCDVVVADGAGLLDEVGGSGGRGRYATARGLVVEADALVVVCDASPHGVTRMLAWVVDARALAPDAPLVVVANRAPGARFRRGELFEEITDTLGAVDIVFAPYDGRVADAAWEGRVASRGAFVRAMEQVTYVVATFPRPRRPLSQIAGS